MTTVVPGEDLFGPAEDGVHGGVVLGYLSAVVKVPETLEGLERALEIVGLKEAVELL